MRPVSIHPRARRQTLLLISLLLIATIAVIDFVTPPLPLGYLYLIPILLLAGFLPRPWIAAIVLLCATLTALFSRYPARQAAILFVMSSIGFTGTGFFVSEVVRNRQRVLEHLHETQTQTRLLRETEEQLRGLVESSPLAILTIDTNGIILLANEAAQSLFVSGDVSIAGQPIAQFLPALQAATQQSRSTSFRTQLRCRGKRKNGELFLAAVWFSTSVTAGGTIVSAIIVDFSEDVRDREDLSLEHLLKNAKILVGALSHEIRNLCGAVLVVYKNLSQLDGMQENEDFRALGTLIEGLENLSAMELRPSWYQGMAAVELPSLMDELQVVIGPTYRESGIDISWNAAHDLPLVVGDRYGLLQVFLNLARNSQRAMESCEIKRLTISSTVEANSVLIRFEDTGVGLSDSSALFQAFHQNAGATGLGLYISRAILRSFRGDLRHEPRDRGCCFTVSLARFINAEEAPE